MSRLLPKRLFARALLILAAPILLLQLLVTALLVERHWAGATRQLAAGVAQEMNLLAGVVRATNSPEEAEAALNQASRLLGYEVSLEPGRVVAPERIPFYDVSRHAVSDVFRETVGPVEIEQDEAEGVFTLRVGVKGGALTAKPPVRRLFASRAWQLLVWTGGAGLVLLLISGLFLRNQIRPIRELARAADAFGKGLPTEFRPSGATEVRQAGAAFLQMRARIERQLAQRTMMLSGVSHDLRTPLTRMRLGLALMEPSPETEDLAADVDEMNRMIGAYLDFAKGEGGEAMEQAAPTDLAREAVEKLIRAGASARFVEKPGPIPAPLWMRKGAVGRALQNLADNAAAHGERVEICVEDGRGAVEIHIDDDGPGIPPERREEAFRPFVRLDAARGGGDRRSGGGSSGVGLGLSIALDAARAHGGDVELGVSPLGGLRATLRLPRLRAELNAEGN